MKPFDLEAAKNGAPICTRKGTPVKFIAHDPEMNENSRVICAINGDVSSYYENGQLFKSLSRENDLFKSLPHENDLFMANVKKTVWVNFYPDGDAYYYLTQGEADECASTHPPRINGRAVPVEIEE